MNGNLVLLLAGDAQGVAVVLAEVVQGLAFRHGVADVLADGERNSQPTVEGCSGQAPTPWAPNSVRFAHLATYIDAGIILLITQQI